MRSTGYVGQRIKYKPSQANRTQSHSPIHPFNRFNRFNRMTFDLGASVPHSKRRRESGEKRRESFFELVRTRSESTAQRRSLRLSQWRLKHVHCDPRSYPSHIKNAGVPRGGAFTPPLGRVWAAAQGFEFEFKSVFGWQPKVLNLNSKAGLGGSPKVLNLNSKAGLGGSPR